MLEPAYRDYMFAECIATDTAAQGMRHRLKPIWQR
jgi:hypothetical protein